MCGLVSFLGIGKISKLEVPFQSQVNFVKALKKLVLKYQDVKALTVNFLKDFATFANQRK